jgi:hypothetical protein
MNGVLERLNTVLGRRRFLRKLTGVAGALVAGIVGVPAVADTPYKRQCCDLCVDPANCSFTGCMCTWVWCCCKNNATHICSECMMPGTPQSICPPNPRFLLSNCVFAKCSSIISHAGECSC